MQEKCRDPGSNRGPSDLQSDALPTELSRQMQMTNTRNWAHVLMFTSCQIRLASLRLASPGLSWLRLASHSFCCLRRFLKRRSLQNRNAFPICSFGSKVIGDCGPTDRPTDNLADRPTGFILRSSLHRRMRSILRSSLRKMNCSTAS